MWVGDLRRAWCERERALESSLEASQAEVEATHGALAAEAVAAEAAAAALEEERGRAAVLECEWAAASACEAAAQATATASASLMAERAQERWRHKILAVERRHG